MSSARPPGRPREFDTDSVLDAALELFWLHGYRATTTRELERAVGLSQSSLYNAFGSKGQLLDAALDRYESRLTNDLLSPLETASTGLASIDAFLAALGEWLALGQRGCMLVNMMVEDGGGSPEISARTRGYRMRLRQAFEGALERATSLGELEPPIEHRANMLVAVVIGLNVAARGGAAGPELAALVSGTRAEVTRWSS